MSPTPQRHRSNFTGSLLLDLLTPGSGHLGRRDRAPARAEPLQSSSASGREAQDLAAADQDTRSATLTDVCGQARTGYRGAARRRDGEAVGSRRGARRRLAAGTGTGSRSEGGAERTVRVSTRALAAVWKRDAGQGNAAAARVHADFTGRAEVRAARLHATRAAGATSRSAVSRVASGSAAAARASAARGAARSRGARSAIRRRTRNAGAAAGITSAAAGLATGTPDLVRRAAGRAATTALSARGSRATSVSAATGRAARVRSTTAVGSGFGRRFTRSNHEHEEKNAPPHHLRAPGSIMHAMAALMLALPGVAPFVPADFGQVCRDTSRN